MYGLTRWNLDDVFAFQHEVERVVNQAWNELPRRQPTERAFQVRSGNDAWLVEVPLPGIDPQHVSLEAAGNALSIRVQEPDQPARYEQTFTVPQFLDVERIRASHRHGMLRLTLPIKESLKPRRIAIETTGSDQKQLAAA